MLPACLPEQLLWLVGDGSALSHVVACAMRGVRLFADLREFRGIKLPTLGADIGSRTLSVNFWHESEKTSYLSAVYATRSSMSVSPASLRLLAFDAFMCLLFA